MQVLTIPVLFLKCDQLLVLLKSWVFSDLNISGMRIELCFILIMVCFIAYDDLDTVHSHP